MRVLLIEGDAVTARATEMMLRREHICVNTTDLGEDGLVLCRRYDYDIVILEMRLPDMSGIDLVRALRKANIQTPVLALSAHAATGDHVKALDAGIDEIMAKPIHNRELVARMRALVRRSRGHAAAEITTGPVTVNLTAKIVSVGGVPMHVTDKEYQILELLSLRRGSTLNVEVFINHLYADGEGPESRTVELFICSLRKKLAAATGGNRCIETVGRRGYMLPLARAA